MKKTPVTVPITCHSCNQPSHVSRAAAYFWDDNSDIDYLCSDCISKKIHSAVIDCDVAKFDAVTNAYTIAARAITPQPKPMA